MFSVLVIAALGCVEAPMDSPGDSDSPVPSDSDVGADSAESDSEGGDSETGSPGDSDVEDSGEPDEPDTDDQPEEPYVDPVYAGCTSVTTSSDSAGRRVNEYGAQGIMLTSDYDTDSDGDWDSREAFEWRPDGQIDRYTWMLATMGPQQIKDYVYVGAVNVRVEYFHPYDGLPYFVIRNDYDEDGRLVYQELDDGEPWSSEKFYFYEEGHLVEETYEDAYDAANDYDIEYTWTDGWVAGKEWDFGADGTVDEIALYSWTDGLLTRTEWDWDTDVNPDIDRVDEFSYDEMGRKVGSTRDIDDNGTVDATSTTTWTCP